jgi:hypothetical protein
LHSLAVQGDTAVQTLLSTSTISLSTNDVKDQDDIETTESILLSQLSLYELLQQKGIVPSLAALIALVQAANELTFSCEWSALHREIMISGASAFREVVLIAVAMLMSLDDGLGLFFIVLQHCSDAADTIVIVPHGMHRN